MTRNFSKLTNEAQKLISVIVPTFNERQNIIPLVKAIHEELKNLEHEIVVVDDNSSDGTYQIISTDRLPYVVPVLRTQDRGLAKSIRCGLEHAKGDLIIVMDSDFNHQPKYIPFMINGLQHFDFVSASRFLYGGSMDSRFRHLASWTFNIFSRVVTGGSITDNLYGFWAAPKRILDLLDYDKIFWGYGDYYIRLMYYLQKSGATVLQFPAVNGRRLSGQGNSRFFKILMQYTYSVFELSLRERVFTSAKYHRNQEMQNLRE